MRIDTGSYLWKPSDKYTEMRIDTGSYLWKPSDKYTEYGVYGCACIEQHTVKLDKMIFSHVLHVLSILRCPSHYFVVRFGITWPWRITGPPWYKTIAGQTVKSVTLPLTRKYINLLKSICSSLLDKINLIGGSWTLINHVISTHLSR